MLLCIENVCKCIEHHVSGDLKTLALNMYLYNVMKNVYCLFVEADLFNVQLDFLTFAAL